MPTEEMENLVVDLAERMRDRFYGKYRGLVTNVDDPDNLGRITAQVPEVFEEEETPWAMPVVPFAGSGHGLVLLPEVGDGVWIEFESGDPSRPLWTGCWWGDGEMPDPGGTRTRVLATTAGHKLVLDDAGDEVKLLHAGGAELKMTGGDITLSIGQAELKMTATGISLSIGASEIKLSPADITIKSGGAQIKLAGVVVNVNNGAITVI
ncbi:MAG TPA: phage baseplate assembly protein V [Pyrinomonadaceae bacterium]